ncbi:MAG TPA: SH3 domain-containing protein, partial [Rhizomicrobium sp.]
EGEAPAVRRANRLALDSLLAVVLATAVVLGVTFYPRLAEFWSNARAATGIGMTRAAAATATHPYLSKPAPPLLQRAIVAVAAANLRALPVSGSHIVATLARGAQVTQFEQHGGWLHVRADAQGATPARDGWVRSTSVKQIAIP